MSYHFPPDVQKLVRDRMADGTYTSEDDLLRDAIAARSTMSGASVINEDGELIEGVRRGLEQMNRGLGRPFEEFDAEFPCGARQH